MDRVAQMPVFLPYDILELISHHSAASTVQFHFRRWRLYSHARRPDWPKVREHLGAAVIRSLWPYALVRREWRTEPSSWTYQDDTLIGIITSETQEGYWGAACAPLQS